MTTASVLADVPPYNLQHLISNVNELLRGSPARPGTSSSRTESGIVEVRCVQALGTEIYIGCSDGSLLRYAYVDSLGPSTDSYQLLTHQALPSGHAIERITLAPSVEKALVLCDHQVHFFTLPNLEPVEQIKPLRNVVSFALDDAQQRKPLPDRRSHQSLQSEFVKLCVIKRNSIGVYNLGARLLFRKEIPLPNGATLARLSDKYLCFADHTNYNIIDLETTSLIPLLPLSQAAAADPVEPLVTIISEREFLLLSWTGSNTLGVFISGTGDPVRGTLEWGMHPVALCCDYPYVTSLLPNGSIEVHSLESQSICQVLQSSGPFSPMTLEKSFGGYVVPCGEQKHNLDIVDLPLIEPDTPNTSAIEEGAAGEAHSNPQDLLLRRDSLSSSSGKRHSTKHCKAGVLVVGTDAVYSLATPTLVQQVDTLLQGHKLKEVTNLAKEHQKKLEQQRALHPRDMSDIEVLSNEVDYIYQQLGYKYLSETSFEDAGNNLFRGNVDPRLLIRLFPALRGTLLSSAVSIPVFSGLVSQIRSLGTVDTIIVTNLVKNYTPHLQPNTRSAPPTSELRRLLMATARKMLREYLRKWKNKVLYSGEPVVKEIGQIIDTVLVKLHAESEDTEELYSLVESSEDIITEEVEETLIRTGQYNALLKLHRKRSDEGKLLEILSRLVDGEWTEEDIHNPLEQMVFLLNETRNRALVQRWGLWLVQRDTAAGLKLLMSGEGKRSVKADDISLLSQIEVVSVEAGQQFLEYLILQRHSNDPTLHTRLAQACLDRLIAALQNEEVLEFFRDLAFEYSIQDSSIPFLTYLVSAIEASSPMYQHILTRCCAALFLQGSVFYDVRAMRNTLKPWEDVLGVEVAILDGKLGEHNDALKTLVHTLRDTASADAYCALGGCAVPPKVAQFVGERLSLQAWAALVIGGLNRRRGPTGVARNGKESLDETRGRLLRVLLEVYMSGGEATEGHAARLLNSQGRNLNVLNVLSLVPSSWSLNVVSSFLARSLRQTVHERCEGEILKAVCLGQNLEARDNAYLLVRAQGAVIEEPLPGTQPPPPLASERGENEEKVVIVEAKDQERVEDIVLDEEKQREAIKQGVGVVEGEIT